MVGIALPSNSNGFISPAAISGLVADWDANKGITLTGGKVTTWNDQSGSGHHLTLPSGTGPTVTANALNADSAVTFIGAPTTTPLQVTFTLAQPVAVYMVIKTTPGTSAVNDIICDGKTIVTFVLAVDSSPITKFNCGTQISYNTTVASGAYTVVTCIGNGASSEVDENITSKVTGNANTGTPGGFTVGGLANLTRGAPVSFARILIYNTLPTSGQKLALQRYLRRRYVI